jgi:hypothetical protein
MSTIVMMAVGFGLGVWYATGKARPVRQLWRDARKVGKKVYAAAKEGWQECRQADAEDEGKDKNEA